MFIKKSVVALGMSVVIGFSAMVSSVGASTIEIPPPNLSDSAIKEHKRAITSGDEVTIQGWKYWVGKAAMKAVASALRSGGKALDELMDFLGLQGKALDAFIKHTDDIADVLDGLAKKAAVAEQTIIDTISGVLFDLGVPLSTARTVANVFTFLAF